MEPIDCLVTAFRYGGTIRLTNQTAASSYGIPVLVIEDAGPLNGEFGAADIVGGWDGPDTAAVGAVIVMKWAAKPERTEDERGAARMYLQQWPEGPQL